MTTTTTTTARDARETHSRRDAREISRRRPTTTDDRRPASASASADDSVRHLDDRRNGTSFRGGTRGSLEVCDSTQRHKEEEEEEERRNSRETPARRRAGERDAIERRGPNPSEERAAREPTTRTSVMPPKRAKTTKKTETKKENPKAIVEEEEEYAPTASDGEEDEDEEDLDGEEGDEDVLMVNFDFCDLQEEDFHGLKALMTGYCDGGEYACSDLCDLLINQKSVGTVIKTEGDAENVLGVTSVVSMGRHKGEKFVKDIKKFLLGKVPGKDKKAFEQILADAGTGLLVNERIINVPQDAGEPLISGVFDEIGWATKDEKTAEARDSFKFKNYILVSTLFEEDAEEEPPSAGKKRKKSQPTKERIFPRLEEEIMLEHAKMAFFWRGKQNDENDIADFHPHRCCMVLEAGAVKGFLTGVKELFADFQ